MTQTTYHFTQHILNDAMPARNISREDILSVMAQGCTWRHFNYSMRTRLDDLIVCWDQDPGGPVRLITVWDTTVERPE
jgi:hypothetical protein